MHDASTSKRTGRSRRSGFRFIPLVLLPAALLAGCGSATMIERPPDYVGAITPAYLENIYLAEPGGRQVGFREVFPGFEAQTGIITTPLPFRKVAASEIVYAALRPVAEQYDANANANGYLEGPELLVLYIRESAIGLGHSVDHLGVNPRLDALATSPGDTGGLMQFVERSKSSMTEAAQRLFEDIERLGLDRRQHSGSGSSSGGGMGGN